MYSGYLSFLAWTFNLDITTLGLFRPDQHYTTFFDLSFNAKLYVYFGTPSLWKALLLPYADLPINGLEFEHEYSKGNSEDIYAHQDKYSNWLLEKVVNCMFSVFSCCV